MLSLPDRTDERAGETDIAIGETDVFTPLDLDASRDTRIAALALPRQRGDLAGAVAMKLDPDSIDVGTAAPGPAKNRSRSVGYSVRTSPDSSNATS